MLRLTRAILLWAMFALGCQSTPSTSATCTRDSECDAALVCHFGRCRSGCTANRDCPAGASCLLYDGLRGACSVDVDLGCESGVGRECASGLVCVSDRCVQACDASAPCPSDGACMSVAGTSVSVCFDLRGGDAGVDGSALDASDAAVPMQLAVTNACIGDGFICAVAGAERRVFCWGRDATGTLGLELGGSSDGACALPASDSDHALEVPQLQGVDSIACGESWACAHVTSGSHDVFCWGNADTGILQPTVPSLCMRAPQLIESAGYTIGSLSSTANLVCVDDSSGPGLPTVRCWGGDEGTVHPSDATTPVQLLGSIVTLGEPLIPMAATARTFYPLSGVPGVGRGGACLIDADSEVWCEGSNQLAQTGQSMTTSPIGTAALVPSSASATMIVEDIVTMAAGRGFTCGANENGVMLCWGDGDHGTLAVAPSSSSLADCVVGGVTHRCIADPIPPEHAIRFTALASHATTSAVCGIARMPSVATDYVGGEVYCWGDGTDGANANSTHADVSDPILGGHVRTEDTHAPVGGATAVFVAFHDACAIDGMGALWCWGQNDHGQLQAASVGIHTGAVRMRVP